MPKCRSCGAEITWIKTEAGKNHPVNHGLKTLWTMSEKGWQLVDCWEAHFTTCPDADKWRKKPNG